MTRWHLSRIGVFALLAGVVWSSTGCIRRTLAITTEPSGALLWLNDREVGRTPVEVDFDHYGTYDVRLERDGYEPMMTSGKAKAPWWDTVGLDLIAEAVPGTLTSRIEWHYVMQPVDDDRERLIERARDLREILGPDA
ncbi:MAG: PEGA domain-containing protein [Planctomycetes bacterium]|nr:PEGA domain-containing protein [Planctomycetota bacterium]